MSRKKLPTVATENDVFAVRLREAMNFRNENQSSLAEKIRKKHGNITRQAISWYCRGQSKPDTDRLSWIADILNVSADYLLGFTDIQREDPSEMAVSRYLGLSSEEIQTIQSLNSSALEEFGKLICGTETSQLLNLLSLLSRNIEIAKKRLNDYVRIRDYPYKDPHGREVQYRKLEYAAWAYTMVCFSRYEAISEYVKLIDSIYGYTEICGVLEKEGVGKSFDPAPFIDYGGRK